MLLINIKNEWTWLLEFLKINNHKCMQIENTYCSFKYTHSNLEEDYHLVGIKHTQANIDASVDLRHVHRFKYRRGDSI